MHRGGDTSRQQKQRRVRSKLPYSVVIAGASGVVGSRALAHLLRRDDVERVTAIGRRALAQQHVKLSSVVVDLQDTSAIARSIPDNPALAVCCLGTTMKKAGSPQAFRAVDHDAIVAFGEAARARGAQRFLLVSSVDANPRARNFYLRIKGETEQRLIALRFAQLTIVRPSLIDDRGTRSEYRPLERLSLPLLRVAFLLAKTSRYAPISADTLGSAIVALGLDATTEPFRIVEGKQIHDAAAVR
jgi:uncharacterized protein YbjT (DUF2867 family)